ncbi:putative amidohydrolase [Tamaricihabitans halophyticus]|uniref:Putative amidohydrolase n=1 Tax=Tamaricihabitans halophyticus TaxID=1262583 RepID=A0A4R2Q813_9PSEU|nr:nitrilase-related carbon-nitrogen hydrolase [Tamaricihabitans halophyticus]TCP45083.1 putative amidohydrolase [Tamaricihabitans halophyticus]
MTRVACAQLAPRVGDPVGNRARTLDAIGTARADEVDLLVLPELASSGYMFADEAEARALATPTDGPLLADWVRAAGKLTVVAGFCELGGDGALYNSAAVLDGEGVHAIYRKTHLWDRERLVFTPGDTPPPVVRTRVGPVGVLVCYDLEFPEMPRSLALRGAELIAVPVNWPLLPRPDGERPPEVIMAMAAARTNRVLLAVCDRDGTERGQRWTAGTTIIDESGWIVGSGPAAVADLEPGRARNKSISDHNDVLADRRPELY